MIAKLGKGAGFGGCAKYDLDQGKKNGKDSRLLDSKGVPLKVDKNGNLADDIQILVLEDDGMGYGARNGYCTGIYLSDGDNGKKEVQIWF